MAMMSQDLKYPIDHLERCGLRLKKFREPRLLPCFDSFCKECLSVYIDAKGNGKTFSCPLCSESIDIPENGANGFDTNIHVATTKAVSAVFQRPDCDICETTEPAINRCVECRQNMCQRCSRNHLKIKSTRHHHLANMTDPEGRVYLTSKAFCTKHQSEEITFFCIQCQQSICLKCRLTIHENHLTEDLSDSASKTRQLLKGALQEGEQTVNSLHSQYNDYKNYSKNVGIMKGQILATLAAQTQRLHKLIDEMSVRLSYFVDEETSSEQHYIESRTRELENAITSCKARIRAANQIVECGSDVELVQSVGKLGARMQKIINPTITFIKPNRLEIDYIPSVVVDEDLEGLFGVLNSRVQSPDYIMTEEIVSFRLEESDDVVNCICPTSKGEAWVTVGWTSEIRLINRTGVTIKSCFISSDIDFIALDKTGLLYISCRAEKCIRKINEEMEIVESIVFDGFPRGLAVTGNGNLLVCLPKSKTYFEYSPAHVNIVRKISTEKSNSVNYGETGDLFVYPIRVALNIYGDICVSDNLRHSVTIFEKNGKINSIYYGQKSTDDLGRNSVQDSPRSQIRVSRNNGGDDIVSRRGSDGDFEESVITARSGKTPKGTPIARGLSDPEKEMNPFDPRGLACDIYGHVLVTEYSSNSVHLLDHSGRFLRLLLTEDDGMFGPTSVAIDDGGFLWIGGGNATIRVYKYIKADEVKKKPSSVK